MVTARSGELSESWVTGRLLTDHLAVGGLGGAHHCPAKAGPLPGSTAVALLVVPTAAPETLWARPRGAGIAESGPLPWPRSLCGSRTGPPSLVCIGFPLGGAAPSLQAASAQVWELPCCVALGGSRGFSGPQSPHRWSVVGRWRCFLSADACWAHKPPGLQGTCGSVQ